MTWADPRCLWGIPASAVPAVAVDLAAKADFGGSGARPGVPGRSQRAVLPRRGRAPPRLSPGPSGVLRQAPLRPPGDMVCSSTSGSMLVRDVPDRFTGRLFARDLLRRLPGGVRVAVVRVEGEGEVVCRSHSDRAAPRMPSRNWSRGARALPVRISATASEPRSPFSPPGLPGRNRSSCSPTGRTWTRDSRAPPRSAGTAGSSWTRRWRAPPRADRCRHGTAGFSSMRGRPSFPVRAPS